MQSRRGSSVLLLTYKETTMPDKPKKEVRVKLKGVLDRTSSSVYAGENASLVIEHFDFSSAAENSFGSDVAFLLHVESKHKTRIRRLLRTQSTRPARTGDDKELFALMKKHFSDYFAVKEWLDEHKIPYRSEFDPWA
jgi:hypothetical protein